MVFVLEAGSHRAEVELGAGQILLGSCASGTTLEGSVRFLAPAARC
jgi:hypothetical protein